MAYPIRYVMFSLSIFVVDSVSLFWKHYHKKVGADTISSYQVKGPLDCEKVCVEMGDACQAVNAIYTNSKYACDVMARFAYTEDEVQNLTANNPNGKLIIKRGKY